MTHRNQVSIADTLLLTDIITDGSFDHTDVLDLRCCEAGKAKPIEEATLKRLQNHFIEYKQMPTHFSAQDEDQYTLLINALKNQDKQILMITDEISKVVDLCKANQIPFISKSLYVVETGMGDKLYSVQTKAHEKQVSTAKFGTFGT